MKKRQKTLIVAAIVPAAVFGTVKIMQHYGYYREIKTDDLFLAALTGAIALIANLLISLRPIKPPEDQAGDQPELPPEPPEQHVSVDQYNSVVRKHNSLTLQKRELTTEARYLRARLLFARMNSRALRIAIYFAVWSLFTTLLLPPFPSLSANSYPPPSLSSLSQTQLVFGFAHLASLCVGAVTIPFALVWELATETPRLPTTKLARRVGLIGIGSCGFIMIAISMPYHWSELSQKVSPFFPGIPVNYQVVLLRGAILPVIGHCAAALSIIAARHRNP